MKFAVTENGSHGRDFNLESWKHTPDGRDPFVPEQNLASDGWNCWDNISFCFIWKLCLFFLLTWNLVAKKNQEILKHKTKREQVTSWDKTLGPFSSKAPWTLAHPCCLSCCFSSCSLPALPDTYWSPTAAQQVCSTALKSSSHCFHSLGASSDHFWHCSPSLGAPSSPQVTAPAEVTRDPPRQRLPFQPRSLEIAACPRLDTLPERRQMKPVKLCLWHSELLIFNANCCLGICIWNEFAFP